MTDKPSKIRVMLVEDSAIIRGFMTRFLEKDEDIEIVGASSNGALGIQLVSRVKPDVLILDIEMPVMDGLTALPLILKACPDVKILMCSTLSAKGAAVSLKALELGAADCLVKPTSSSEVGAAGNFQTELLRLVKGLGGRRMPAPVPAPSATTASSFKTIGFQAYNGRPEIIAIGSSTGGPQALYNVLGHMKLLKKPVIITQHMPPTFTSILAQHIQKNSGLPCLEVTEKMKIENGKVYVAPGGHHMKLERGDNETVYATLDNGPPVNFCKPSVDPMIDSAREIYGEKTLAVILTGMGQDGLHSCKRLAEARGRIIAQDEESSVVWGMPGAVSNANITSAVLPLDQIGPRIMQTLTMGWV